MIKTVLFDLGNVLLPFDVTRLARRLTRYSCFSAEDIVTKLWNDAIASHFETGRMSPHAYFEHVADVCQFKNLSFDEFIPIFNDIFDEDKEVAGLIASLRSNYNLGLISNTNAIHSSHVMQTYQSLSHFHRHWFSNEAGVRKPDPAIYKMALDHFSSEPQETIFIDDMTENVSSARNLGINAIFFQGASALRGELIKLGVKH